MTEQNLTTEQEAQKQHDELQAALDGISKTFTVTLPSGEERVFTLVQPKLAQRGYVRRLKREFRYANNVPYDQEVYLMEYIEYILESPARIREAMNMGYSGNQQGIDWAEADADMIDQAIGSFFMSVILVFKSTTPLLWRSSTSTPKSSPEAETEANS